MQLTASQINKFKEIWKKQFGVEISEKEAKEQGLKMVRLVEAVLKPENDKKNYTNH
jgi:hypothetical protein